MIPLGVLGSASQQPSGSSLLVVHIATGTSTPSGGGHPFTTPIGEPRADRHVIIAFAYRLNLTTTTAPTVTINGAAATMDVLAFSPANRMVAAIAHAHVPTGETAQVSLTWGVATGAKVAWSVFHAASPTPVATGVSAGSGSPATLTAPAGASTVAVSITEAAIVGSTATWTGANEVADKHLTGGTSVSTAVTTVSGTIHPAAEWVSPTTDVVTVAAAYL